MEFAREKLKKYVILVKNCINSGTIQQFIGSLITILSMHFLWKMLTFSIFLHLFSLKSTLYHINRYLKALQGVELSSLLKESALGLLRALSEPKERF